MPTWESNIWCYCRIYVPHTNIQQHYFFLFIEMMEMKRNVYNEHWTIVESTKYCSISIFWWIINAMWFLASVCENSSRRAMGIYCMEEILIAEKCIVLSVFWIPSNMHTHFVVWGGYSRKFATMKYRFLCIHWEWRSVSNSKISVIVSLSSN